jgi:hypothetical protein
VAAVDVAVVALEMTRATIVVASVIIRVIARTQRRPTVEWLVERRAVAVADAAHG